MILSRLTRFLPSLLMTMLIAWTFVTVGMSENNRIHDSQIFKVIDFGAKGDGVHPDTRAIQSAIDSCAQRGGTVFFPAGTYLTGTIFLKNHVTMHIAEGATLLGSTDIREYVEISPQLRFYGDSWAKYSLIYGEGLENIAIVGRGSIDGQGDAFKVTTKNKPDRYRNRPCVIWLVKCHHVLIENLYLKNSARWMQHYLACEDLRIHGIRVYNHCNQNNDMMDIDGCRDVLISDCIGDSDDDGLTLKSTSDRACENIAISNCILSSHVNALKFGTESHGGFRNISISNIVIRPSACKSTIFGVPEGVCGINLSLVDGGILEGVTISNVSIDGPRVPLFLRLGDRGRIFREDMPRPAAGIFRNVRIHQVSAAGADCIGCSITGLLNRPIENVSLSDIRISFRGGGSREEADRMIPEKEQEYPESTMFGNLPAYGFYVRHAKEISLNNIDLSFEEADHRPALSCEDVQQMRISGLAAMGCLEGDALIRLQDTADVLIHGCRPTSEIGLFLSVRGKASKRISVLSNDLRAASYAGESGDDVPADAIQFEANIQ